MAADSLKPTDALGAFDTLLRAPRPLRLDDLSLSGSLRALVLAPHPDDFDAIAVTLRRLHAAGYRLDVAVLTSGASGVEDGYGGATGTTEKAALRETEQRESCAHFGLPPERLRFLRLWANGADEADDARLREYVLAMRPHLAFMPHGNDSNRTHRRVYRSFDAIARAEGLALWAFLNRDAKTDSMRLDLYCDFDEEEARWKASLLRLHRSQQARNLNTRNMGFDDRVLAMNRESARLVGAALPYAECFELQRYSGAHG